MTHNVEHTMLLGYGLTAHLTIQHGNYGSYAYAQTKRTNTIPNAQLNVGVRVTGCVGMNCPNTGPAYTTLVNVWVQTVGPQGFLIVRSDYYNSPAISDCRGAI